MKFTIAKDELTNILTIALKGMSSRATLPILAGILVTAEQDKVVFQTTDLEISIWHEAAANVQEGGKAVIPGKLFSDIVKSLPDAAVQVSCHQNQTTISCLDSSFTLSSLNPADFPPFPQYSADTTVELPSKDLSDAVRKVSRAVSRDESRAILTGILLTLDGDTARFTATDSYRLAIADLKVDGQSFDAFQAIVPGKTLEDVARLSLAQESIEIGFSSNQVIFKFGGTVFVSRKIEGAYPNVMQLVPDAHEVSIHMDTAALTTAVKRVSLLAQAHTPVRFQFSGARQLCTVSAQTQDVGGATENVEAKVEGDDIEIAFNHQYVLDGLAAVGDETLIELQNSLKPGIFKTAGEEGYLYLAMPVRLG